MNTNDVLNVSLLFHAPRFDRKALDRVLRSKNYFETLSMRRRTSCLASGHPLPRLIIHSTAVSLAKFRMLANWCRVGSSICNLNNIPPTPQLRLPFLWRHFVGSSEVHLRCCPNFPWFRTCDCFLHALTTIVCIFNSTYMHNPRNYSFVPSRNDALRHNGLEVPC